MKLLIIAALLMVGADNNGCDGPSYTYKGLPAEAEGACVAERDYVATCAVAGVLYTCIREQSTYVYHCGKATP